MQHIKRGQGEALSIKQMVDYMKSHFATAAAGSVTFTFNKSFTVASIISLTATNVASDMI